LARFSYSVHIPYDEITALTTELKNQASFNPRLEKPPRKKLGELDKIVEIRVKVDTIGQPQQDLVEGIIRAHNGSIINYYAIGTVSLREKVVDFFRRIWLTTVAAYLGMLSGIIIYSYQNFIEGEKQPNIVLILLVCFIPAIATGLAELKKSH
jgi:hypothetical protein